MKQYILFFFALISCMSMAVERTILIGPKTIGRGWKDNIVLEARHFAAAKAGDILTVYYDQAKRTAQGAFQDPDTWQGIAPQYNYFSLNGPFQLLITDTLLPILQTRGVAISGHDYRILQATLTDKEDWQETIVWRGPSVQMSSDWSVNAELPGSCFRDLRLGDGLRLHISRAKDDATTKLMDVTWNAIEPAAEGIPVGGDQHTYYLRDEAALIRIALGGTGMNTALRIGGKNYRLDKVGIVRFVGEYSEDLSQAQRAPKEYILQPDELFHGEKTFPLDWRGNLRVSAEKLQNATENDVLIISYKPFSTDEMNGRPPVMSFRENRGSWPDLSGSPEPNWMPLDGNDIVLTFDSLSLDKVKTRGFVICGMGFTLTRVQIIRAE